MKRLHIVGKSKDNKKIFLARASDAKFGSMEIPIGRKLVGLVKEAEEAKRARSGKPSPEQEAKEAKEAAKQAEARAKRSEKSAEDAGTVARLAAERLRETKRRAKDAESRATKAEQALATARAKASKLEEELRRSASAPGRPKQKEQPAALGGLPAGGLERAVGVAELEGLHGVRAVIRRTQEAARDDVTASFEPPPVATSEPAAAEPGPEPGRTAQAEREAPPTSEPDQAAPEPEPAAPERPRLEPMPASRLSPAEIQTLLRAGRGVRAVAKQADVPVDWVRRLAAPIEAERLGVVTQLFQSFQERTRLGRSAMPVGPAIVENLRDKGVRFPERVIEEGWSATRSDGRAWRVRFTYESRGRNQRADWRFDPQARTVEAANSLATELGFRSPEESDGTSASSAAGIAAAMRPRAITGRSRTREPSGTSAAKKAGARKSGAARTKTTAGKRAVGRKRTTGGRKSGGRKKASGKRSSGRSRG